MERIWLSMSLLAFLMLAHPALAMNWEGHDDWLSEQDEARQLRRILPRPMQAPQPTCVMRSQGSENNPYEQRPLPGQNCVEGKTIPQKNQ